MRRNHRLGPVVPQAFCRFLLIASWALALFLSRPGSCQESSTIVILDDGDPGTYTDSNWRSFKCTAFYGRGAVYAQKPATYHFAPQCPSGNYRVYLWWPDSRKSSNSVTVVVGAPGDSVTLTVDQTGGAGQWNLLGSFQLEAASEVVIRADKGVATWADAVMFECTDLSPEEPPPDEPPAAPVDLMSEAASDSISLTWSPNTEEDLASYAVYRSTLPDAEFVLVADGFGESGFTDTHVTNGTTYYYFVTAIDLAGNESEASAVVNAMPPVPPSTVTLAWDHPLNPDGTIQEGVVGYTVYYGPESQQYVESILVGNVTSWTIQDLAPGTYFFAVTAWDDLNRQSDYSNEVMTTLK